MRKSQLGETGHCPTCHSLNHLSENGPSAAAKPRESVAGPAEVLLEKVSVAKPMTPEEITKQEDDRRKRRRQYTGGLGDQIDWEEEGATLVKKGPPLKVVWSLVMGSVVLLALGIHYVKNVKPDPVKGGSSIVGDPEAQAMLDDILEKNKADIYVDETGKDSTVDAVDQYKRFDMQKVEVVVKGFLKTQTVEERAKWSCDSERVLPLMKKFYEGNEIESEGFEFLNKTEVSYRETILTTLVQTADFLTYPIAVERNGEGEDAKYHVDWESWVGYCAMNPEEMRRKKPTDPVLMRVIVSPANYYNYTFADDKEWRSYRMELRDSEYAFLGYAKKNSEIDKHFSEIRRKGGRGPCIVKVVYPPNARAQDQVEIVEIISDGWILPESAKKK